ncbi:MAG TPA: hypothetical protein VH008_18815 [Pseudonocardia sp.]|nr:hypothetical protein [Pseudonocardia sp.]
MGGGLSGPASWIESLAGAVESLLAHRTVADATPGSDAPEAAAVMAAHIAATSDTPLPGTT